MISFNNTENNLDLHGKKLTFETRFDFMNAEVFFMLFTELINQVSKGDLF